MSYHTQTFQAEEGRNNNVSLRQSFAQLSGVQFNEYNPEEDYIYKPVSETDPWYTADYIQAYSTSGGEFFVRRGDGSAPTNVAETYVGPYYRWVREPQYSDSRKLSFGRMNDVVIGESYYGKRQKGKPKNQGLRQNRVLEPLTEILRSGLGGPVFLSGDTANAPIAPVPYNNVETKEAAKKGVLLNQSAKKSTTVSDAIVLSDTSDSKYIHITDLVTLEESINILGAPNSDMRELAPPAKRFGLKGRPPVITNQPNAKIDFDNEPLG